MANKDLEELQQLFKDFEEAFPEAERVGGRDKDKLEASLKQGKLSKAEAAKLSTDLKAVLSKKTSTPSPPPAVPESVRTELPSSSGQFLSRDKGFQLKTQIERDKALVPVRKPDTTAVEVLPKDANLPKSLVPVNINKPAKIPGVSESTVKLLSENKVFRKFLLPLTAIAGVAGLSSDSTESVLPSKEFTPSQPPAEKTEPSTPTRPATEDQKSVEEPTKVDVPAEPAAPAKGPSLDWNKYSTALEQISKNYAEDRQLPEEVRKQFDVRQQALGQALSDARGVYQQAVDKAQSAADRREAIIQWASIAESLGQSMVKYFAAREGARRGQAIGSSLQLKGYDWQKELDRSLEKLKQQTDQAKTTLGIATKEVETGTERLGEERKELVRERQDVARQRARAAEEGVKQEMRAEAASVEDYIRQKAADEKEAARQTQAEKREAAKQTAAEQKAQAADQKVLKNSYARLEGLMKSLAVKDTAETRKQLGEAAAKLKMLPHEVEELIDFGTGKVAYSKAEEKEKIRSILDKYNPDRAAPAPVAQSTRQAPPAPGTIKNGYRFKGGNPADSANWEKVK